MDRPDVTVAIPTMGRWQLLPRTLRSALSQTGPKLEVIVALDTPRSEGPPAEVLAACDGRVRLTRAAQRGLSHARNAAIDVARGEWIAFLDDDDLWAPTKLTQQLRTAGNGTDFVYGGAMIVSEDLEPLEVHDAPSPAALPAALLAHSGIPAGASNVMVRTAALRRCGSFDPRFAHLADWDLWIRLAASSQAAAVPEIIVAHVRHPGSMLFQGGSLRKDFRRLTRKHTGYAAKLGGRFDERMLLEWLQTRHEAAGHVGRAQLFRLRRVLSYGRSPHADLYVDDTPRPPRPEWLHQAGS